MNGQRMEYVPCCCDNFGVWEWDAKHDNGRVFAGHRLIQAQLESLFTALQNPGHVRRECGTNSHYRPRTRC
jgi:hypothetical protein